MKRWRRTWRRSAAMIGSQGWRESVAGGRAHRARSEADGIYKMAGTRWRIAARNQRPERGFAQSWECRRHGRTSRPVALSLAKMAEIRTGNGRTVALLRFAK